MSSRLVACFVHVNSRRGLFCSGHCRANSMRDRLANIISSFISRGHHRQAPNEECRCARICLMQDAGAATIGMLVWTETWATSTPPPRPPSPTRGLSPSAVELQPRRKALSGLDRRSGLAGTRHRHSWGLHGCRGGWVTALRLDWWARSNSYVHPAAATSMATVKPPSFTAHGYSPSSAQTTADPTFHPHAE